jgi:hypothetical protein
LLLLLLLLALPLLVLHNISVSYDTRSSVSAYAETEDIATSYTNGMHTLAIFDNVINIFEGEPLEHQVEVDANQIFPNETLKREIIANSAPLEFTMPVLNYNLLGFNISASNIEVVANPKQVIDDSGQTNKTRIDFPVMRAKNVNVTNGSTTQSFNDVDLSSIYAIYDPATDKFTFHIPFDIAARYLLTGS